MNRRYTNPLIIGPTGPLISNAYRPALGFLAAARRRYDVVLSLAGLLLLSPVFLFVALLIKLADGGSVFYRQTRIGQYGRPFVILKFRTMVPGADKQGPAITKDGDTRITRLGRLLRKTKLDELPQLWNVLKGEMALVGPRPEVPRYVERYTPAQRQILDLKPGITDLASLYFKNEEALLRNVSNLDEFYVRHCLPRKLDLNLRYAQRAGLLSDTWIILQTVCPYWLGVLASYTILLAASFWCSYELAYDFSPPAAQQQHFPEMLGGVVALQLLFLTWRKQCQGLLSYFSFPELRQIGTALGLALLVFLGIGWLSHYHWLPRHVVLLNLVLSIAMLGTFRVLLRLWRERFSEKDYAATAAPARVGIIGAGTAGAQVARELAAKKHLRRTVTAFFDDDCQKWNKLIHQIPVVGMPECLLHGWNEQLDEVIIAMPGSPDRRRELDALLQAARLKCYALPSLAEFWNSPSLSDNH